MTARLVPNTEIERVLRLAQEHGIAIAALDVGPDYVRTIPPQTGGESIADYIGPVHRPKAARQRAG
jgi:hypothetical protein